jgi:hypothetical protein
MVAKLAALAALSVAAAIASAAPAAVRQAKTMYKAGEKCMGASGYAAVPYLPCEGGAACNVKASDWGFVCAGGGVPTTVPPATKKAYKAGEKCMGASGYTAVPYLPCEGGAACNVKASDWGFVCAGGGVPTTMPPATKKVYKAGEKCMGASGYTAVPYLPCEGGAACNVKASDWGFLCAGSGSPTTMPPSTTKAGCKRRGRRLL